MKPISFSYSEHERLKAENEQLTADVEGWKQNFTTERNNRIAVTADLDAAAEWIAELGEKLCGRFEPICMSCAYCTDCDHDHSFRYIRSVTREELAQIDPIHLGEEWSNG